MGIQAVCECASRSLPCTARRFYLKILSAGELSSLSNSRDRTAPSDSERSGELLPRSLSMLFKISSGDLPPRLSRKAAGPGGRLGPPGGPTVGSVPSRPSTRKSPVGTEGLSCASAGHFRQKKTRHVRGTNHRMVASFCGAGEVPRYESKVRPAV